ncbi:MAG: hypothetical protein DRQ57_18765 [Gammaproteobacteria bacterium]|nr:MAG: hypothetical protein DRQ57_18765 [Gammaproteobacteria bacterium]
MMIKILICGEGEHDMGKKEYCPRKNDYKIDEGWIQKFIRKIKPHLNIKFETRRRKELISFCHGKKRLALKGHSEKAFYAMMLAKREGYDAVVFMVDADTKDLKQWQQKCMEIFSGFAKVKNAPLGITCVPKSASESWLLSDNQAWAKLGLKDLKALPTEPEMIWGKRRNQRIIGDRPHLF